MGSLIKLRISLADRAGALAQAATVIGIQGGNIVSIDVHRTAGERAVDDVVVAFSDPPDLEDLAADLSANAATTLIAQLPADGQDPIVALLEGLAGDPSVDGPDDLVVALRRLCSADRVWVAGATAEPEPAGQARRTGAPAQATVPHAGERAQVLAVPHDGEVILVARPEGLDYTLTEIARVQALLGLAVGYRVRPLG